MMTFTGFLLFVLYGLTTNAAVVKVHIHVNKLMTCKDAKKHCELFYNKLSTVSSNKDLQMLGEAAGGTYGESWISSKESSCKALKSEDTNTSVVQTLLENPSYCAVISDNSWKNTSCLDTYSFFCYENFILVQENKTWEEALVYCRSYYADLASFYYGWPVNQIKNETNNAQTDSVWTGLRFLNGNWYWLNVINGQNNFPLPSCPPEPYRCGARNTKTEQWENRDCEEKLNFFCLY